MRSRIFRRYFWSALLLFVLSLLAIDFYVVHAYSSRRLERLNAQLELEARILAGEPIGSLPQWAASAAARSGARVQILNAQGGVEADSGSKSGDEGDSPWATVPLAGPEQAGWRLRLSMPLTEVNTSLARLAMWLGLITLASVALALGLTYLFMRSFSRRMQRLRTYIEGLPEASLPDEELPGGNDALGSLSQALRQTAPKIRDLVDKLKLEGARREAILASMVEGVLAVDKELRVTFCNRSFARTMGARMPVPEGMPLLDLARDPALRDVLVTVLQTGQIVERRIQLRGVQAHSFEVQAVPLAGPSAHGALAILHDITELERLERVRKDFVANVSHELRTPLAAIRGYAETLLDGALEDLEHNRKFVEVILAHAIRLNNIASDLLILSELESSGGQTQPKRVSIRSTIEAALRTVESAAKVRGVKLTAGAIEPLYVKGYEIRLEQAFVNLLDNAVKFNRPDGEVRIETALTDQAKASITISDTGIGIPSDDLPRIFERFYRVDKARSRAVGGTGLGLSIVRHVIEQMGGTIRVQSQLGKGSQFVIELPCEEVPIPVGG
jgi:two-component system phosphate regulon sensor histidine kinase PhoR